ncbi:hypothetical protein EON65_21180 [archaeon]|nr:MAG: hypothetical protein EON65_21180 [archaeon]
MSAVQIMELSFVPNLWLHLLTVCRDAGDKSSVGDKIRQLRRNCLYSASYNFIQSLVYVNARWDSENHDAAFASDSPQILINPPESEADSLLRLLMQVIHQCTHLPQMNQKLDFVAHHRWHHLAESVRASCQLRGWHLPPKFHLPVTPPSPFA